MTGQIYKTGCTVSFTAGTFARQCEAVAKAVRLLWVDGVTLEAALDQRVDYGAAAIAEYLGQVAPVGFSPEFRFE